MSGDDSPEDGGRDYSDEQLLEAIESGANTTATIADVLGTSRRRALERLERLREDGKVRSREVGRKVLWRIDD